MRTTLQVVTQPINEPASIDLVRLHTRIDHSSDDLLLEGYLSAARTMAESYLSRALLNQTLLWTMMPETTIRSWWEHHLPRTMELPRAPVQSISSVVVLDERGNSTTISPATLPIVPPAALLGYIADLALTPSRLTIGRETVLIDGRTLCQAPIRHLQVQFVAGYGPDLETVHELKSIPQPIINAILLTTAFLYENRGDAGGELPQAARWLLDPYRLHWVP